MIFINSASRLQTENHIYYIDRCYEVKSDLFLARPPKSVLRGRVANPKLTKYTFAALPFKLPPTRRTLT